jgi:ferredoxin
MEALKDKELIIFCTQMIFSGDGARAFTDIFSRGYAKVIYAEHFFMPNNVCNLFLTPLAGEKRIQKYLAVARRKMESVCRDITNGKIKKRGFNIFSRVLGLFQGVFFPMIEKKASDRVWIDKDCNKCLLCVSVCPMNNFEHKDGEITTKNNCTLCYRCINKCPQKAISVFLRGKVKKQYSGNPDYFT